MLLKNKSVLNCNWIIYTIVFIQQSDVFQGQSGQRDQREKYRVASDNRKCVGRTFYCFIRQSERK